MKSKSNINKKKLKNTQLSKVFLVIIIVFLVLLILYFLKKKLLTKESFNLLGDNTNDPSPTTGLKLSEYNLTEDDLSFIFAGTQITDRTERLEIINFYEANKYLKVDIGDFLTYNIINPIPLCISYNSMKQDSNINLIDIAKVIHKIVMMDLDNKNELLGIKSFDLYIFIYTMYFTPNFSLIINQDTNLSDSEIIINNFINDKGIQFYLLKDFSYQLMSYNLAYELFTNEQQDQEFRLIDKSSIFDENGIWLAYEYKKINELVINNQLTDKINNLADLIIENIEIYKQLNSEFNCDNENCLSIYRIVIEQILSPNINNDVMFASSHDNFDKVLISKYANINDISDVIDSNGDFNKNQIKNNIRNNINPRIHNIGSTYESTVTNIYDNLFKCTLTPVEPNDVENGILNFIISIQQMIESHIDINFPNLVIPTNFFETDFCKIMESQLFSDVLDKTTTTQGPTVGQTAGPTVGPTTEQTAGQTTEQTAGQTAGQTYGQTTGPTAGQTYGQTTGPTAGPTAGPTTGQTAGLTAGLTVGQTAGLTAGPTSGQTVVTPASSVTPASPASSVTPAPAVGVSTQETTTTQTTILSSTNPTTTESEDMFITAEDFRKFLDKYSNIYRNTEGDINLNENDRDVLKRLSADQRRIFCQSYCQQINCPTDSACDLAKCFNCGYDLSTYMTGPGEVNSSLGYSDVDGDYSLSDYIFTNNYDKMMLNTYYPEQYYMSLTNHQYAHRHEHTHSHNSDELAYSQGEYHDDLHSNYHVHNSINQEDGDDIKNPVIIQKDTEGNSNIFAPVINYEKINSDPSNDPNDPAYRKFMDNLQKFY